ncbi:hypothetical protein Scep_027072 [Stephania cephalantha]|uniref:Major facilitator superfamily (MFS) profile domain-containing protein n=1 Tax=Stephania cephalantha TaxID=152367 RepID=A0AAP0ETJ3_9MAGN
MASRSSDPEQPELSFFAKNSSDEIGSVRELLIDRKPSREDYTVTAAILPFFFPALGGLLYGYDIGATSGAQISIKPVTLTIRLFSFASTALVETGLAGFATLKVLCADARLLSSLISPTLSGITWYNLSSVELGLIVSGSLYGALIGSILAFTVADYLGRRRELILSATMYLVGAIVTSIAPDFAIMVIGRFLYGIGIGLFLSMMLRSHSSTKCNYVLYKHWNSWGWDIWKPDGAKSLVQLGYVVGSLEIDISGGWRYMYATSAPISLIMGIGMWWLPPSPRWLLLCAIQGKGRVQDARETAINCLCVLRGPAIGDSAPVLIDEILTEVSCACEEKETSITDVFRGKCLKALIIGAGLVLFQQITGQPSVLYYAAAILQSAGFSAASDATRVSILLGLLKLIMTGVAVVAVDKLGRRPLLLGGVSGIVISLFLLASYYTVLSSAPAVAVVALLLYVGCYQLSFGPIGWLMISEIFPLRLRGRGLSIAVLVNFAANALVTFAFSPLQSLLGAGILFVLFGVIAILSLIFIFFVVPETKGLTLEEIEAKIL